MCILSCTDGLCRDDAGHPGGIFKESLLPPSCVPQMCTLFASCPILGPGFHPHPHMIK